MGEGPALTAGRAAEEVKVEADASAEQAAAAGAAGGGRVAAPERLGVGVVSPPASGHSGPGGRAGAVHGPTASAAAQLAPATQSDPVPAAALTAGAERPTPASPRLGLGVVAPPGGPPAGTGPEIRGGSEPRGDGTTSPATAPAAGPSSEAPRLGFGIVSPGQAPPPDAVTPVSSWRPMARAAPTSRGGGPALALSGGAVSVLRQLTASEGLSAEDSEAIRRLIDAAAGGGTPGAGGTPSRELSASFVLSPPSAEPRAATPGSDGGSARARMRELLQLHTAAGPLRPVAGDAGGRGGGVVPGSGRAGDAGLTTGRAERSWAEGLAARPTVTTGSVSSGRAEAAGAGRQGAVARLAAARGQAPAERWVVAAQGPRARHRPALFPGEPAAAKDKPRRAKAGGKRLGKRKAAGGKP